MRLRVTGAFLFAFVLLLPAAFSLPAAGAPTGGVQGTFFGVTIAAATGTWPATVPFGTVGKTASGGPGGGTYWSTLEPSNNTFAWTPLDDLVDAARSAGVTDVMYTFFETPAWASSQPSQSCFATANFGIYGCAAPPKHLGDWDRFVTALVTRYKGEIQFYELWNEPNVQSEYSGNVSAMVSMAKDAYAIIHSVDPSAKLLAPGVSLAGIEPYTPGCALSQCWLATYLMDGGAGYADGVAFHGKTCTADNQICVQEGISCPTTELPTCEDSGLVAQIGDAKSIMATDGISGKPLVNTEGGYSDEVGQKGIWGSEEHQTAFLSRFYIVQASENVTVAVWFSWLSNKQTGVSGFGTSGYKSQNNRAYETVRGWLLGSTFDGPCARSVALWSCGITSSSGQRETIVWAENDTVGASYSAGEPFEYQDLNGTAHQASQGVALTEDPILVQGPAAVTTTSATSASSSRTTTAQSASTRSLSTVSTSEGSSSSAGGGRGAIPEFPYQLAAAAAFVLALVVGYGLLRRRRPAPAG